MEGNIWTEYSIQLRKPFINTLSETFQTTGHKPIVCEVECSFNNRKISIPTFSFVHEAMSLLDNPTVMSQSNIIDGYDIYTGKCGDDFWEPSSLSSMDANVVPTPIDPSRKIGDIHTSYLFQQSVARFCTKPNHMPIPLILFYDKANLDRSGGLAVAPLLFTWGFFKNSVHYKSFVWKIKAYIPNLDIGQGKSNLKSADEKQREHHLVLAEALRDFQEICDAGGFKTYVGNKLVILKFSIQYIVGDTAGHNDLCCHFQKKYSRSVSGLSLHRRTIVSF